MDGSATLTIVMSTSSMNVVAQTAMSVHRCVRRSGSGWSVRVTSVDVLVISRARRYQPAS
jgi:hypothetical protein